MTTRPLLLGFLLGIAYIAAAAGAQSDARVETWGEPVEGIQLQLTLADGPQLPGGTGALPPLQIRFRNQGSLPATYVDWVTMCLQIEMDGVWGFQDGCRDRLGSPQANTIQIPGGGKSEMLSFKVERMETATNGPRQLDLKPGKHTIRVRAELADGDCGRIIEGHLGNGSPFCLDKAGNTSSVTNSKVTGVLTSNPVTFDFPVRADLITITAPQCGEADSRRRAEMVVGGVERGETFTQTPGNFISRPSDSGWILKLVPVNGGWQLQMAATGREDDDLARLTPPWHLASNPRQIEGWHLRNEGNTGPNDGSVNAPGLLREFIFSPAVGREINYNGSATPQEDVEQVRSFGRGWLLIDSYRLTPPAKGERAAFESLTFHACLTWPR